jgi:hypothetical protein
VILDTQIELPDSAFPVVIDSGIERGHVIPLCKETRSLKVLQSYVVSPNPGMLAGVIGLPAGSVVKTCLTVWIVLVGVIALPLTVPGPWPRLFRETKVSGPDLEGVVGTAEHDPLSNWESYMDRVQ